MSIGLKTHKILWGKSGNRCAFPYCKMELALDEFETDDPSVVGQEAHIVAKSQDGPRGESELTSEQRDKYGNLILLCSVHHKVIDDNPGAFPVEKLKEMKTEHEQWVKENLNQDEVKTREDLIYSDYIDKVIELADVKDWELWTSNLLCSGHPSITEKHLRYLEDLKEYIFNRVWLGRYPALEKALQNLMFVLNDFISIISKYIDRDKVLIGDVTANDDKLYRTETFYKTNPNQTQERYDFLLDKWYYHCELVIDLCLEFTRALNHVFDIVRKVLFPIFRMKEGVLVINNSSLLSTEILRPEYRNNELETLYPGLKEFMSIRENRNCSFGRGVSDDYSNKYIIP